MVFNSMQVYYTSNPSPAIHYNMKQLFIRIIKNLLIPMRRLNNLLINLIIFAHRQSILPSQAKKQH